MNRLRLAPAVAGVAFVSMMGLSATPALAAAPAAAAAPHAAAANAPKAATAGATINQVVPGVGTLVGTFVPTNFSASNGQLTVTGLLNGTLTSATGVVTDL